MTEDLISSSLPDFASSRKLNHDKIESIDQDIEVAVKNILKELQEMREFYEDGIYMLQNFDLPENSDDVEKALLKLIEGLKKHIKLQESLFKSAEQHASPFPSSFVCLKYENGDDDKSEEHSSNSKTKIKVESEEPIETEDLKTYEPFDPEFLELEDIKLEASEGQLENLTESAKPKVKSEKKRAYGIAKLKCDKCSKEFGGEWRLHNHMKTHQIWPCDVCGKEFKFPNALRKHKECHSDVKAYKCEFCFKGFKQQAGLYSHLKVHTAQKTHACDLCESAFITAARLIEHKRTHTGEKPFTCEACGFKCATNKLLYRHRKIHTGVKNFVCHICEKAFARSDHLKQHIGQMHIKLK